MEILMEILKKVGSFFAGFLTVVYQSRKAKALLVGIILALAGKAGLDLSHEQVLYAVGLIATFMVSQGLADFGKEKVLLERADYYEEPSPENQEPREYYLLPPAHSDSTSATELEQL
jgi:hypothetical protein